jgi:hypothetical protein
MDRTEKRQSGRRHSRVRRSQSGAEELILDEERNGKVSKADLRSTNPRTGRCNSPHYCKSDRKSERSNDAKRVKKRDIGIELADGIADRSGSIQLKGGRSMSADHGKSDHNRVAKSEMNDSVLAFAAVCTKHKGEPLVATAARHAVLRKSRSHSPNVASSKSRTSRNGDSTLVHSTNAQTNSPRRKGRKPSPGSLRLKLQGQGGDNMPISVGRTLALSSLNAIYAFDTVAPRNSPTCNIASHKCRNPDSLKSPRRKIRSNSFVAQLVAEKEATIAAAVDPRDASTRRSSSAQRSNVSSRKQAMFTMRRAIDPATLSDEKLAAPADPCDGSRRQRSSDIGSSIDKQRQEVFTTTLTTDSSSLPLEALRTADDHRDRSRSHKSSMPRTNLRKQRAGVSTARPVSDPISLSPEPRASPRSYSNRRAPSSLQGKALEVANMSLEAPKVAEPSSPIRSLPQQKNGKRTPIAFTTASSRRRHSLPESFSKCNGDSSPKSPAPRIVLRSLKKTPSVTSASFHLEQLDDLPFSNDDFMQHDSSAVAGKSQTKKMNEEVRSSSCPRTRARIKAATRTHKATGTQQPATEIQSILNLSAPCILNFPVPPSDLIVAEKVRPRKFKSSMARLSGRDLDDVRMKSQGSARADSDSRSVCRTQDTTASKTTRMLRTVGEAMLDKHLEESHWADHGPTLALSSSVSKTGNQDCSRTSSSIASRDSKGGSTSRPPSKVGGEVGSVSSISHDTLSPVSPMGCRRSSPRTFTKNKNSHFASRHHDSCETWKSKNDSLSSLESPHTPQSKRSSTSRKNRRSIASPVGEDGAFSSIAEQLFNLPFECNDQDEEEDVGQKENSISKQKSTKKDHRGKRRGGNTCFTEPSTPTTMSSSTVTSESVVDAARERFPSPQRLDNSLVTTDMTNLPVWMLRLKYHRPHRYSYPSTSTGNGNGAAENGSLSPRQRSAHPTRSKSVVYSVEDLPSFHHRREQQQQSSSQQEEVDTVAANNPSTFKLTSSPKAKSRNSLLGSFFSLNNFENDKHSYVSVKDAITVSSVNLAMAPLLLPDSLTSSGHPQCSSQPLEG